jgi:hypothetical protein
MIKLILYQVLFVDAPESSPAWAATEAKPQEG